MLRSRTLLRLGDPQGSLAELDAAAGELFGERAEATLLRVASLTRLRRFDEAASQFVEARVYAISSADAAIEAEAKYYETLWAFATDDLEGTQLAAREVLAIERSPYSRKPYSEYFIPLQNSRARALEALGAVEGVNGRYSDQLAFIRQALSELYASGMSDIWVEAALLTNAAILARDFDIVSDVESLRSKLSSLPWSPSTARNRFRMTQALGWCRALHGDHIGAFRDFRGAVDAAPSQALRVSALLDQAYLARELANVDVAHETLGYAADLAEHVRWEETAGDDRATLLWLAEGLAEINPGRAKTVFERYRACKGTMSTLAMARIEKRVHAIEAYVRGIIARHEGKGTSALTEIRTAFEIWNQIGFEWRAGLAAADLFELGCCDVVAVARREADRRSGSWLARRVAKALSATGK